MDCHYCGVSPSMVRVLPSGRGAFTYNGLDRVDNTLGYMLENVVPCCKTCNIAKGTMPYDDFMAWIGRLIEYHWFRPELTPSRLLKGGA
jgi:hypothetical protein